MHKKIIVILIFCLCIFGCATVDPEPKWQELEDKMDKSDRSLESLAIKSNTLFNLYFNTSDEIIEASEYPNPLKHSLECCEQAKKLQEEKARELLEKHLAQITNAQQDES